MGIGYIFKLQRMTLQKSQDFQPGAPVNSQRLRFAVKKIGQIVAVSKLFQIEHSQSFILLF